MDTAEVLDDLLRDARRLFSLARLLDDEDLKRKAALLLADVHRARAEMPLQRTND